MKDIFKLGIKGPIPPDEIYKPKSTLESKKVTGKFIEMWSDQLKQKNPSLLRVIFKYFGAQLLFWGLTFSIMESSMRLVSFLILINVFYFSTTLSGRCFVICVSFLFEEVKSSCNG